MYISYIDGPVFILDDEIGQKDPSYLETNGNRPMKRARLMAVAKFL